MTAHATPSFIQLAGPGPAPKSHRLWNVAILVMLAFAGVSCSSVKIQSLRNPAVTGPVSASRLLVVAQDPRPEVRAQFESQFAGEWNPVPPVCSTSYGQFPLTNFSGNWQDVCKKLATAGVETVLLVRVTDRTTSLKGAGINESGLSGPVSSSENTWMDKYDPGSENLTSTGEIKTRLVLGGKLFRCGDGVMLWSTTVAISLGENTDPYATMRKLAGVMAGQMRRDKIFN